MYVSIWDKFWHCIGHSFWHILRHSFWHSTWHLFWHVFWPSIRHSIWHTFWQSTMHSIWHIFWHPFWRSIWHMFWYILFGTPSDNHSGLLSGICIGSGFHFGVLSGILLWHSTFLLAIFELRSQLPERARSTLQIAHVWFTYAESSQLRTANPEWIRAWSGRPSTYQVPKRSQRWLENSQHRGPKVLDESCIL